VFSTLVAGKVSLHLSSARLAAQWPLVLRGMPRSPPYAPGCGWCPLPVCAGDGAGAWQKGCGKAALKGPTWDRVKRYEGLWETACSV